MRMHMVLFLMATILASAGFNYSGDSEQAEPQIKEDILTGTIKGLEIDNLLTSQLESVGLSKDYLFPDL